ncbi:MAG: RagB/SusD family nutrient uptake outer membrane protein [Bacteroidota bacterium]
MMKYKKIVMLVCFTALCSCKKYLNVVPDNIATIETAFSLRTTAEKYLFTCYSYMPLQGDQYANPAFQAGDELWHYAPDARVPILIARGNQNIVDPYSNYWDGAQGGKQLYNGIRDCNIFLDNIGKVKEMTVEEKARWTAEVKFLKAYYHFWLFRMYGPIPLIKVNQPISASVDAVQIYRSSVDECVDYIVQLLDESVKDLPQVIDAKATELGRITKPIALSVKAQVLTTAASPLFNGNSDYAGLADNTGKKLFNQTYDANKWVKATAACKDALDACAANSMQLYDFNQEPAAAIVTPQTRVEMSIRNSVAKKWNTEVIWGNPNSNSYNLQIDAQARFDASNNAQGSILRELAPTLKMAEMFYTKNGVPINEDKTWDYTGRYNLRTATIAEMIDIKPGLQTASLHFDREPRFYASVSFDSGTWYGEGNVNENNLYFVEGKSGQNNARQSVGKYSITGYLPKKLVNVDNVYPPAGQSVNYVIVTYPWPVIRLADMYLLYAETLNETNNQGEALTWINKVRARAGVPTVQDAWTNFSTNPSKFTTQAGLRTIIHQERGIELSFEGQRFWDIRRWKEAIKELNGPVKGWDILQVDAANYYRPLVLFSQTYQQRDYLWPIKELDLIVNKNLVQNPGW